MAAADALHPVQFEHHKGDTGLVPVMNTMGAAHPELTDGSGMNAATLWSETSALKTDTTATNAD